MHLWGWWQEVYGLHDHPFGIEENSDKCTTILEIHSPTNIGEVQKLNSRLALQSRFLPRLAEKAKPFYKLLWKTESFLWDEACMQAFLAFKKTITTPTILSQPKPGYLCSFTLSSKRGHQFSPRSRRRKTPNSHILH